MRKFPWLIVTAVVLLIATAGAGITGFILAGLVLGVPYLIGCVFHPRTTHRGCKGKGYHRSPFYLWGTRKCRGCVNGLQVRHGARVVGMPHIRAEHKARTAAVARNKRNRTWR
jgi:hypothetical protein